MTGYLFYLRAYLMYTGVFSFQMKNIPRSLKNQMSSTENRSTVREKLVCKSENEKVIVSDGIKF